MLNPLNQAERTAIWRRGVAAVGAFSFSTKCKNHYFQMAEHYTHAG